MSKFSYIRSSYIHEIPLGHLDGYKWRTTVFKIDLNNNEKNKIY